MIKSIRTINDMKEIGEKKNLKNKPLFGAGTTNPENPYGANDWLFQGIGDKNKR